jgi:predicted Zn-dependent peptidase
MKARGIAFVVGALLFGCGASAPKVAGPRREMIELDQVRASASFTAAMPAIGAPVLAPIPHVTRVTFDNGVSACIVEKHGAPLFAIDVVSGRVDTSSAPLALLWFNALQAHALDGTLFNDGMRKLSELGVSVQSGAEEERLSLRLTGLSDATVSATAVLSAMLLDAAFGEASVGVAKSNLEAAAARDSDAGTRAWIEVAHDETLTRPSLHKSWTDARVAELRGLGIDDVVRTHLAALRPEGVTVLVAGDFTTAVVRQSLAATFGQWRLDAFTLPGAPTPTPPTGPRKTPSTGPHKTPPTTEPTVRPLDARLETAPPIFDRALSVSTAGPASILLVDRPHAAQATIGLFSPARTLTHADRPRDRLLGDVVERLLMDELRDARGLTYGAFSGSTSTADESPFVAFADVDTPRAVEATRVLVDAMLGLTTHDVAATTLQRAKTRIVERSQAAWLSNLGLVEWLRERVVTGEPCDSEESESAAIVAVDAESLRAYAAERLSFDGAHGPLRVLVVGDAATLKPALEKLGYGAVEVRTR